MSVMVSAAWLLAGARVTIQVPARLSCGACDGGGCDRCGRSGAVRLALDPVRRTTAIGLPATRDGRVVLRLARPLGGEVGLDQLSVEVIAAESPSDHCALVEDDRPTLRPRTLLVGMLVIMAALAVIALALR